MNETTALADYIVPDTHNFESWGVSAPWAGVLVKASTARWPVVGPRTARTAQGEPVAMESFLIAVAKAMKLPGFGANAMQDSEGNSLSLDRAEDYYLRAAANIAYGGEKPLPAAVDDELRLTGVDRLWPALQRSLYQDEQRRVAYLLARGGRFAPYEKAGTVTPLGHNGKNHCKSGMKMWRNITMLLPVSATAAARPGIRRAWQTARMCSSIIL